MLCTELCTFTLNGAYLRWVDVSRNKKRIAHLGFVIFFNSAQWLPLSFTFSPIMTTNVNLSRIFIVIISLHFFLQFELRNHSMMEKIAVSKCGKNGKNTNPMRREELWWGGYIKIVFHCVSFILKIFDSKKISRNIESWSWWFYTSWKSVLCLKAIRVYLFLYSARKFKLKEKHIPNKLHIENRNFLFYLLLANGNKRERKANCSLFVNLLCGNFGLFAGNSIERRKKTTNIIQINFIISSIKIHLNLYLRPLTDWDWKNLHTFGDNFKWNIWNFLERISLPTAVFCCFNANSKSILGEYVNRKLIKLQ